MASHPSSEAKAAFLRIVAGEALPGDVELWESEYAKATEGFRHGFESARDEFLALASDMETRH